MPKPKLLAGEISVSEPFEIVALTPEQKSSIEAALRTTIALGHWEHIEAIRRSFAYARSKISRAVEASEVARKVGKILKIAEALLAELTITNEIDAIVWKRLHDMQDFEGDLRLRIALSDMTRCELSYYEPPPDQIYSAVCDLVRRAKSALGELEREPLDNNTLAKKSWNELIFELGLICSACGVMPTATKSSNAKNSRPSHFVGFVRAIIATMPQQSQVHMQSVEAMANQISPVVAQYRDCFAAMVHVHRTRGPAGHDSLIFEI